MSSGVRSLLHAPIPRLLFFFQQVESGSRPVLPTFPSKKLHTLPFRSLSVVDLFRWEYEGGKGREKKRRGSA